MMQVSVDWSNSGASGGSDTKHKPELVIRSLLFCCIFSEIQWRSAQDSRFMIATGQKRGAVMLSPSFVVVVESPSSDVSVPTAGQFALL